MKKKKKQEDDNGILGFLLGLGAGAMIAGFLSLFERPVCPICGTRIAGRLNPNETIECSTCHSKLRFRS